MQASKHDDPAHTAWNKNLTTLLPKSLKPTDLPTTAGIENPLNNQLNKMQVRYKASESYAENLRE